MENTPQTPTVRILVIEDDPAVARSLHDELAMNGYEVLVCASGAAGLKSMQKDRPHLVVLDVRLPDGSGFDFCRKMRQQGLLQPVLILTVQDDDVDKVLGLEIGADDYMTKPYNPRELNARIRALLRRAYGEFSQAESKLLFVQDLTVDLIRAAVWRAGAQICLTPTEYRLFTHLAKYPGQVFNRGQLISAIWGETAEVESDPQAVTVYIRRLREKLELDPDHPRLILTVPGLGYRLAA